MKGLFFILPFILLMQGCVSTGSRFEQRAPSAGSGQLVIYRVPSTPAGREAVVSVNGETAGYLSMESYLYVETANSSQKVMVTFPESILYQDVADASVVVFVEEGKTVYVRYDTSSRVYGFYYELDGELNIVPPDLALDELEDYGEGRYATSATEIN